MATARQAIGDDGEAHRGGSLGTKVVLRLYIAGSAPHSVEAVQKVRRLCDERLAGRHELEVIDIFQTPSRAAEAGLSVLPMLIKELPLPRVRVVGDLGDDERILAQLGALPGDGGVR